LYIKQPGDTKFIALPLCMSGIIVVGNIWKQASSCELDSTLAIKNMTIFVT